MTVFFVLINRAGMAEDGGDTKGEDSEGVLLDDGCNKSPPLPAPSRPSLSGLLRGNIFGDSSPGELTMGILSGAETVRAMRCLPVTPPPGPPLAFALALLTAHPGEMFPGVSSSSSEKRTRPMTRFEFNESNDELRLALEL